MIIRCLTTRSLHRRVTTKFFPVTLIDKPSSMRGKWHCRVMPLMLFLAAVALVSNQRLYFEWLTHSSNYVS